MITEVNMAVKLYCESQKARVLVTDSRFHPSLTFAGRSKSLQVITEVNMAVKSCIVSLSKLECWPLTVAFALV